MRLSKLSFSLLLPLVCAAGCVSQNSTTNNAVSPKTSPDYNATKWYRDSAERSAIDREVFYVATNIIKHKVATEKLKPHQWGIILDVDDTILDNSDYAYAGVLKNRTFDIKSYATFVNKESAFATPGAKAFLLTIHHMGGYVNLVTNRFSYFKKATLENLHQQGLYFDQILLAPTLSMNKNSRFAAVEEGRAPSHLPPQKIIAWFGDNIQDFPALKQSDIVLQNPNGNAYQLFGVTYFIVPNPMYGSWQKNKFH